MLQLKAPAEKARLRILEFLLLFPEFIGPMSLSSSLRSKWNRLGVEKRFSYEERPPAPRLFDLMEPSFEAAFQTLVAKGVIKSAGDSIDLWELGASSVPEGILRLAKSRNNDEEALIAFLCDLSAEFTLEGAKGLKARSGLMEYRYDVV